jgi:hypothetical protein
MSSFDTAVRTPFTALTPHMIHVLEQIVTCQGDTAQVTHAALQLTEKVQLCRETLDNLPGKDNTIAELRAREQALTELLQRRTQFVDKYCHTTTTVVTPTTAAADSELDEDGDAKMGSVEESKSR